MARKNERLSPARFRSGDTVAEDGLYRVYHRPRHLTQELTLPAGASFPPCVQCGAALRFELVRRMRVPKFRIEELPHPKPVPLTPSSGEGTVDVFPLIFDSFAAPTISGVRAAFVTSRRLLYRKDENYVDIQLEYGPRTPDGSLVGQLLGSRQPQDWDSATVELFSDGTAIAKGKTSTFGEFHFLFPVARQIELRFDPLSRPPFFIRIPPLATAAGLRRG